MVLSNRRIDFFLIGALVVCLPFMFRLNMVIELNVSLADILIVIILFWLISIKENQQVLAVVLKQNYLIIVYMLLLIYFCIISMANYFTNIYIDFPYGLSAIIKLFVNFIYVLVLLIFIEKYKDDVILLLFKWWRITAIIISVLCIISVILYRFGVDNGLTSGGRAQATLNDPNLAALYLIVSFTIVAISSTFVQKKLIVNVAMVVVLIALVSTASRGGMVSIVFSVLIVLFLSLMMGRIKELFFLLIIGSIISFIILLINSSSDFLSFAMERVARIGTEGDGTSDRILLWKSAYEMWMDNPFIGIGIGQFIPYSTEMYGYTFSSIPHNTYLSFLSETGILGFLAFIWFPMYLVIKVILGLIKRGGNVFYYLFIGLNAIAIQSITINIENIRFIWIYLAVCFVLIHTDFNQQPKDTQENSAWIKLEVNE
ncbi:hypothetical protein GCM10008025_15860 [Ornithinibacillus halotolerans]|uniref:O-antigen ligase-related domain-containing protein n=2 Tax=Ornithinibacillus halotolerans TaxID=1274357 RepID=A0A916RY21_9BACI|nr:hypothetical protein GCM10008025_15860 [Ornithinibacillus halotolerans]